MDRKEKILRPKVQDYDSMYDFSARLEEYVDYLESTIDNLYREEKTKYHDVEEFYKEDDEPPKQLVSNAEAERVEWHDFSTHRNLCFGIGQKILSLIKGE